MDDLTFQTASQLAEAIRTRQVSSTEVVATFLDRIEAHNPRLNAVVTRNDEAARRRAREADEALARGEVWGPLHGVPLTLKDSFETAGLRTTSSYKPLADHVPQHDATVVARLRAAGAILLGKTNLPQLAGDNQSHSPLFGPANNPWDLARTPGGSSGGEAAALAAGLSPLGLGSDIAGSIRIPAHFCGLFGLKPTDHRVPNTGHIPPLPGSVGSVRHMPVNGPLARSVDDLRLCLSLIAGPDGQDTGVPPMPLEDEPPRPLSELRFAWSDDFGGIPVSADTHAALAGLAGELAAAGCHVERANPPGFDFQVAMRTYAELYGTMIYATMPPAMRLFMSLMGPIIYRDDFFRRASRRARARAVDYFQTLTCRDQLQRALESFLAGYDAWLCPVASVPAFAHRRPDRLDLPLEVDGQMVPGVEAALAHTLVFNLTGHPVMVLPLAQSAEGLPIGLQVVGRLWGEMPLLNVAQALTEITGPFRRPPGY